MTLKEIDKLVNNHMTHLYHNKIIKNVHLVKYRITSSGISDSLYVKFSVSLRNNTYRNTLRISDHETAYTKGIKNNILVGQNNEIYKKQQRAIKRRIDSMIKKLLRSAFTTSMITFKNPS